MKKTLLFATMLIAFAGKAQLRLVSDLRPGFQSSTPTSFFVYDGKLFFSATVAGGRYVCSTDGTNTGTEYVRFDNPTTGTPAVNTNGTTLFYEYNGNLYFDARVNSTANVQIVKLTGASNAVSSIFDLTNSTSSQSSRFTETFGLNDKLLFNSYIPYTAMVLDLQNSANSGFLNSSMPSTSNPKEFTVLGTNCFFASSNSANGRELWKTDGTSAGTTLYLDINAGATTSDPKSLNILGSQLTFVATHATYGKELFKTNGTGSLILLKDINPSGDSTPSFATVIGSLLYFGADNGTIGRELWTSAGTTLSTLLVKDINPVGDSNPSLFTKAGNIIYFTANDGTNGIELWKTDGTASGTLLVKNINPTGDSSPSNLVVYNGKLYFVANNGTNGAELWVSDGTDVGTTLVADVNPGASSSTIAELTVFNNELYFGADANGGIGKELYAYMDPALNTNQFVLNGKSVRVYPNPSNNYFQISSEAVVEKVALYSIQGQLVKSFEKQEKYDVSDLAKGVYLIKIYGEDCSISKQIIVE